MTGKLKIYDATHLFETPPEWSIALPAGTDCTGLEDMEREIVSSLGIAAEFFYGGIYETEADAVAVAKEMASRRPDLIILLSRGDTSYTHIKADA